MEAGASEDDLDNLLSEVRSALEAYTELVEDEESEPEDRASAWEEFTDSLSQVDFSELEEEE